MTHIHTDVISRYEQMLHYMDAICYPEPGTDLAHIKWMIGELRNIADEGKAMRWLGLIQGVLILRGFTTVTEERDFTRPYFTK